jgi:hypothetical protein
LNQDAAKRVVLDPDWRQRPWPPRDKRYVATYAKLGLT